MPKQVTQQKIHDKHQPNIADVVTKRRETVERLRIRGLSMREIVDALAKPGESQMLNPMTNEPFTLATIKMDIQHIRRDWLARTKDNDYHRARVLASLRETERAAWTAKDLSALLRALKQQCELLGLDAPTQYEHLLRAEAERMSEYTGKSADELLAEAKAMMQQGKG